MILHCIEAVVSVGLCVYARMPMWTWLAWPSVVLIFGTPSMQNCLKVAVRYAMYRDPVTFGIPEGVLDGGLKRAVNVLEPLEPEHDTSQKIKTR